MLTLDALTIRQGDFSLTADWSAAPAERVAIYRHLAEAKKLLEIEAIAEELKDRFGRLPVPAQNLLGLASARLLGTMLGLRSLRILSRESFAVFAPEVTPAPGEPFRGPARSRRWSTRGRRPHPRQRRQGRRG